MTALPRMSHSRYDDLAKCGELYRLKRVERVPRTPSIYAIGGTGFHEWTDFYDTMPPFEVEVSHEDWYADRITALIKEAEEKTEYPLKDWDNPQHKPDANVKTRDKFQSETGPDMIRKYIAWRANTAWSIADMGTCRNCNGSGLINGMDNDVQDCDRCHRGKCDGIEYEANFTVHDVEVIAKIDRIFQIPETGELVAIDTKTWSKKRVTAQLPTYLVALRQVLRRSTLGDGASAPSDQAGFDVSGAAYYEARKGTTTPIQSYKYWDEDRLAALHAQAAHMIANGVFLPRPSEDCRNCDVRRHCVFALE